MSGTLRVGGRARVTGFARIGGRYASFSTLWLRDTAVYATITICSITIMLLCYHPCDGISHPLG